MNQDAPDSVVFENLMQAMYCSHPIRVPILGTGESIRQITPQTLYHCHRAFYTPGNMLLCVVGDVDPQGVEDMARQVLGTERREVGVKLRPWHETMHCPVPEVTDAMEVAMPMFNMAFKCEPLKTGEASIRMEMVADLAAEALFGRLSLPGRIIPLPSRISAGCGLAWKADPGDETVLTAALDENGIGHGPCCVLEMF